MNGVRLDPTGRLQKWPDLGSSPGHFYSAETSRFCVRASGFLAIGFHRAISGTSVMFLPVLAGLRLNSLVKSDCKETSRSDAETQRSSPVS